MFGITLRPGHPNPVSIYLPDGFEGHPLRKSYPAARPRGEALAGGGGGGPAAGGRGGPGAGRPREGGGMTTPADRHVLEPCTAPR